MVLHNLVGVLMTILAIFKNSETKFTQTMDRPNILMIMVDDLRPALGCYGHKNILTPNIDQFTGQSFQFTNAYAQQALCGPSRTSLLTSRRPDTTRLYDFYSYWRETVGNYTTLPQYFKENGYRTISIGKIFHHGVCSGKHQDYPYSWSEIPYIPETMKWRRRPVCPGPGGKTYENLLCPVDVKSQPLKSLPDIQNADKALEFLKNHSEKDEPFFLGVGLYKPHVPFKFPKEYLDLYQLENIDPPKEPKIPINLPKPAWNPWTDIRSRHDIGEYNISFPYGPVPDLLTLRIRQHYYASTTYMDYQLGRVLAGLDKYNFSRNTVISFLGDHGWSMGEHQEWSKYSVFDMATRVPFMMHIPWMVDNSKSEKFKLIDVFQKQDRNLYFEPKSKKVKINSLVEAVDLFPTLVETAGLKPIPQCGKDTLQTILCTEGKSLLPLMKNPSKRWKKAAFSQYPRPSDFPREDSDKPRLKDIRIMGYSMRSQYYRYTEWLGFSPSNFTIHWSDVHGRELYDLRFDPDEGVNVAGDAKYAQIVQKLAKDLRLGWRGALPRE